MRTEASALPPAPATAPYARTLTVGGRCREARLLAGLSLRQAAKVLAFDAVALGEIERDVRAPCPADLLELARVYGVRAQVLREGVDAVTEAEASAQCGAEAWARLSDDAKAGVLTMLTIARAGR